MAKPAKPKSLKPKADGLPVPATSSSEAAPSSPSVNAPKASKGLTVMQTLILALVMLVTSIAGPALTLYFLAPMVLKPMIAQMVPALPEGEEGEHGTSPEGEASAHGAEAGHGPSGGIGMNLGLDDFTVNLHRPEGVKGNQFLRAKMSLSVQVPEEENCFAHGEDPHGAKAEGGGGGHGGGGEAADPVQACTDAFNKKMGAYVPTLRDIINTALMKRSAQQIATLEGQEDLKDELTHEMNTVLKNHGYTVQRVNLQDFIIQR
jgi:flagellar basal body-associated protein FliL